MYVRNSLYLIFISFILFSINTIITNINFIPALGIGWGTLFLNEIPQIGIKIRVISLNW